MKQKNKAPHDCEAQELNPAQMLDAEVGRGGEENDDDDEEEEEQLPP